MRITGILIVICGLLGLAASLNLETTVPSGRIFERVHNIGLMNEKQNFILISLAIAIGGIILAVSARTRMNSDSSSTQTCPYCAETIKAKAVICRFCGQNIEAKIATTQPNLNFLNRIADQPLFSKAIMISFAISIVAILLPWESHKIAETDIVFDGAKADTSTLLIMAVCWLYPIYAAKNYNSAQLAPMLLSSATLTFWIVWKIYQTLQFSKNLNKVNIEIFVGSGTWFAFISALLLLLSIPAISRKHPSSRL